MNLPDEDTKSEPSEEPESSTDDEDTKSEPSEEPESSTDDEDTESESSTDDEDAQSETGSPAISVLDWSDTTPAESLTIEVRVPRRTLVWLQTWTLKDVKKMRPCDKKWKKEDQRQLLADVKRVLAQPTRVDGDWVYVTEQYAPAKNGFPGRLMSSGLQGLQGQIRANLLAETADINMSACMHRILLWVCKNFNEEKNSETGVTTKRKVENPFINKWMDDQHMDAKYLPEEDKDKRYYWDRFDMIPPPSKCLPDVYKTCVGGLRRRGHGNRS